MPCCSPLLLLLPVQGEAAAGVAGGSTSVQCCLCPIKRGAFKKTTDTKEWCHMVCGLWHQELVVLPGNICEVVQSKAAVRPEKVGLPCACCQLPYGAVIKCSYGHCQVRGGRAGRGRGSARVWPAPAASCPTAQ